MKYRLAWIGFFALMTAGAHASFDLMLIPTGNNTGYVRFDPVNRVSLGSLNIDTPRYAAATPSRQFGYFAFGGGTLAVNHSTGEVLSNPTTGAYAMAFNETGSLVARAQNSVTLISGVGSTGVFTSQAQFNSPTFFSAKGVTSLGSGRWLVYGTSGNGIDLYVINDNGTLYSSQLGLVNLSGMSATGLGQGTMMSQSITGTPHFVLPFRDNTGAHRLTWIQVVSGGSFLTSGGQALYGFSTANPSTMLSAVAGHTGFYVVGGDSSVTTATRITQFADSPNFSVIQNYTTTSINSYLGSDWRMSNIVAPEPASMAGLGLGLVLLASTALKRR